MTLAAPESAVDMSGRKLSGWELVLVQSWA